MKLKRIRVCLAVILLISSLIPFAGATFITVYPQDSWDDAFVTGSGNYFGDSPFLPLRSVSDNNILGTRFKNVNIPQGSKINNATLKVRTLYGYPAAGDIRVTITGDDIDDSSPFNDSSSFTRTYTAAFEVWNISLVNGNAWSTVDVTDIVQEIIDRVGWTSGNSLSLVYFTDKGTPRREFATLDNNAGYKCRIEIFHSVEPTPDQEDDVQDEAPGPFNDTDVYDWGYNETYRGIDIYVVTEKGDPELLVTSSDDLIYFNSTKGDPNYVDWAASTFSFQSSGSCEFIAVMGDWIFLIGQNGSSLDVYYSDDEFQTWQVDRVNNNFPPGLDGRGSDYGSIWPDQNGTDLLHLVWSTYSDWNMATYDIVYSNFTIDPVTKTLDWSDTYFNVTEDYATDQTDSDIYLEKDGTIHIAWIGKNGTANDQAMYRRRQANGTWLDAVRLSGEDVRSAWEVDIVANEDTGLAMAAWTSLEIGNRLIKWDIVFPNNTVGTALGETDRSLADAQYVSMVNDRKNNIAHMTFQKDSGLQVVYRNKAIDNTTAWSAQEVVSPAAEQHYYPVIGIDEDNETLAIVWWNQWNAHTAYEVFQTGSSPIIGKATLLSLPFQYPSMMDYFSRSVLNTWLWLVYPNGTLVEDVPVDGDPYDEIDDLLGGAQPDDPQTDYYGPLNKFSWKLLVLAIGMVMLLGSPIAGIAYGADVATWVKLFYIMFFGMAILTQIKFM